MLLVIGRVSCEPERREELIGLLRRMEEDSRREEGCLRYGFFAAVEDENSYIAVEEWTDREALDRHFAEPHLHEFSARLLDTSPSAPRWPSTRSRAPVPFPTGRPEGRLTVPQRQGRSRQAAGLGAPWTTAPFSHGGCASYGTSGRQQRSSRPQRWR